MPREVGPGSRCGPARLCVADLGPFDSAFTPLQPRMGRTPPSNLLRSLRNRMGAGAVTQIKICGVTTVDDALASVRLGADAIGINLWKGSKRCVDEDTASRIVTSLPNAVRTVLVVVNPSLDDTRRFRDRFGAHVWLQLHGDESPDFLRAAGPPALKALTTKADLLERAAVYSEGELLLDAAVPGQRGGTGQLANWELAAAVAKKRSVWLSGGLGPGNVAAGVGACRPFGVDVASGVERAPGEKDLALVEAFVEAVRAADRALLEDSAN